MSQLYDDVAAAIGSDRVLISFHADERLEERNLTAWQIVGGFADARVVEERPTSRPNPTVVVRQTLPNGEEAEAVWAYLRSSGRVKLVTVYLVT